MGEWGRGGEGRRGWGSGWCVSVLCCVTRGGV